MVALTVPEGPDSVTRLAKWSLPGPAIASMVPKPSAGCAAR